MDTNNLVLQWENLSDFKGLYGYKALRTSSRCIPDLFIGTDEDGNRCLLLFLPNEIEIKLNGAEKEKLILTYLKNQNTILIKLKDSDFIDLFNDLIVSLHAKIEKITDPNIYSKELIYGFYKWSEFFENKRFSKLTPEKIKGLIGELIVLNHLLLSCDSLGADSILESWKGPFDYANDFVFDNKNIEVKTKESSQQFIKISSEFQLECEFDKGLELIIVSVKVDLINGFSIHDLLTQSMSIIRDKQGDLSILYNAINQIGLTIESSKEYNNYRFVIDKTTIYDCAQSTFPKLNFSNIPQEITQLIYKLRISSLNDFLISEKKY